MPKWRPAPAALIQQFTRAVERIPSVEQRKILVVPEAVVDSATELPEWVERARRFAASLPAKQAAKKGKKPSPIRKGRGR
jgi:hypothetical protein